MLIVTKCPPALSAAERQQLEKEIRPLAHQRLFFSSIRYGQPYHIITKQTIQLAPELEVLLVSGIANPEPLKKYLHEVADTYYELLYSDHHIFSIDDLKEIQKNSARYRLHKSLSSPLKKMLYV